MLLADRLRVSDLWNKQKEIQTQKEILKAMVKNSSTESLVMVMEDFCSRRKNHPGTGVPELVTYIVDKLTDRGDNLDLLNDFKQS